MITVEQVSIALLTHFKATRLAALKDTPSAFGSTYAKESQLTNEDWIKRVVNWNNDGSVCYLAMDRGTPCGIVAGKCGADSPKWVDVLSMWVAPTHRRAKLGKTLIDAVESWAKGEGASKMRLTVVCNNAAAIAFYERCSFGMTGRTEPYPNDPALFEYEMVKLLRHS
jgi:ribosomal protein S18 acetylase RimI-like enzyme